MQGDPGVLVSKISPGGSGITLGVATENSYFCSQPLPFCSQNPGDKEEFWYLVTLPSEMAPFYVEFKVVVFFSLSVMSEFASLKCLLMISFLCSETKENMIDSSPTSQPF